MINQEFYLECILFGAVVVWVSVLCQKMTRSHNLDTIEVDIEALGYDSNVE
jgi:hypothetical protein